MSLVSCAKRKWDKETLSAKLKKELKSNSETKKLGDDVLTKISDCAAEKIVGQYKTEAEANKNQAGVKEISMNCTLEAMGMGVDKPVDMTPTNDMPEPPPDSTDHQ